VAGSHRKSLRRISTAWPIAFHLIGGETSDTTHLEISLDIGPDSTPRVAITDTGYDFAANRAARRKGGIIPVIPHRANAKNRPSFFPKLLYKTRARVEQAIDKLKRFERITMRCKKTTDGYGAFVAFACTLNLGQIRPQGLGIAGQDVIDEFVTVIDKPEISEKSPTSACLPSPGRSGGLSRLSVRPAAMPHTDEHQVGASTEVHE
jgi:hypothetical protein